MSYDSSAGQEPQHPDGANDERDEEGTDQP